MIAMHDTLLRKVMASRLSKVLLLAGFPILGLGLLFLFLYYLATFYDSFRFNSSSGGEIYGGGESLGKTLEDLIIERNLSSNFSKIAAAVKKREHLEQILAIIIAYPDEVENYYWDDEIQDAVLVVNGRKLAFAEGRLLFSSRLTNKHQYRSIMYPYALESIYAIYSSIPEVNESINTIPRSTDLQAALINSRPRRSVLVEHVFFEKVIVTHPLLLEQIKAIEAEANALAAVDEEVENFLSTISEISNFSYRTIRNSDNISLHAYGLAIDLLHEDYDYKSVYWQWTKILHPKQWKKVPIEQLWVIPEGLVSIFERNGFIWGGKWANYDSIHFEYRPELIEYAKIRTALSASSTSRMTP